MMTASYADRVSAAFSSTGDVCWRCQLRYGNTRDSNKYRNSSPEPSNKTLKRNPCIACVGVLQDEFMGPSLVEVSNVIKNSEYDSDHFSVAISLPVSLTLREHSLNLFLKEKVSGFAPEDVVPIKQVWKWLFPSTLKTGKKYVTGEGCDFFAELQIKYSEDKEEMNSISLMCKEEYQIREQKIRKYHMGLVTRQGVEKSLHGVPDETFRSHYSVPPKIPSIFDSSVIMYNNNIYIGGRYNKYSRTLPQTPWLVDGERKLDTSVEELILEPIKAFFKFDDSKFYSSGREDVDVRMLGTGRPFAFEFINPRKTNFSAEEIRCLEEKINSISKFVAVRDLQVINKVDLKTLKEGEDQKTKNYRAVIIIPSGAKMSLDTLRKGIGEQGPKIKLSQWTPIRVLHRRPNSCRTRAVSSLSFESFPKNISDTEECDDRFIFSLTTEAGTYVKEFVHGDFGRTEPSLKSIFGCAMDIEALDVQAINVEWPVCTK